MAWWTAVRGIETVARALNMSVRTFQRRLAEAGWRYKRLLDDVRFTGARCAMSRSDDPLKAVAIDLGFVEQASFTRALRRWTGSSSREYRRWLIQSLQEGSFRAEQASPLARSA